MAEPVAVPDEMPGDAPVAVPVIVRDAAGQDFTIDASELDTFVRSGQYQVSPRQANETGAVPIRGVDGTVEMVGPAEAQERIASFAADASTPQAAAAAEEERRYSGALQGARALSAGALSTLPGAIPLLTAIDPTLAPDIEGLQRYRSGAFTAGELGAVGAALLATGGGAAATGARALGAGTRAIASAGELAATGAGRLAATAGLAEGGLLARGLAAGARGAVEVGLFEANREINQAAIQQRELEASKVFSALGHGALMGGALMGAGSLAWGAGGKALGALSERVGAIESRPFAEKALEFAREKTLKATGGTSKEIGKILEGTQSLRNSVDDLLTKDVPKLLGKERNAVLTRAEMQEGLDLARRKIGNELGDALKTVDANAKGIGPDLSRITARAREEVLTPLESSVFMEAEARAVAEKIQNLESLKDYRVGFDALHELSSQLGAAIRKNPTSAVNKELAAFREIMEEEILAGAERVSAEIGGNIAGQYAKARVRYAAVKAAEKAVKTGVEAEAKNLTFSLSSMIAGGSGASLGQSVGSALAGPAGGLVGGAVGGIAGAVLANLNKRLGDQVVSSALRAYAQGGGERVLSGLVDRAVSTSVGRYLQAGARALPSKERAAAAAPTTARFAATRAAESEIGRRLFGEAPRAEQRDSRAPARVVATRREDGASEAQVKRAVLALERGREQARAVAEETAARLPERAPEIRGQLAASERAFAYLTSKIPATLNTTATLTPQAEAPRMSKAQRDEFLTAARVVADPLSVLDSLQNGTLSKVEVEALRATAPELYASIQTAVQADLSARPTPLPYRQSLELSVLLGVVGHPSLDRRFVAAVQQAYAPPPPAPAPSPPVNAPKRVLSTSNDWSLRPEVT